MLEVEAEIQQRLPEDLRVAEEQCDHQAAHSAIAIQERVDRLELDMREVGLHQRRQAVVFGVQEAFVDYHIRNVSERYDFDSVRVGIQPFQADFRGFLFNDQQLGFRLFGCVDLLLEQNIDCPLRPHHGNLGAGPGVGDIGAQELTAHHHVGAAIGLARDDSDFGDRRF